METQFIMYREEDFEECIRIYIDAFTTPPLNYDFVTKEKAWRYIRDITRTPGFLGFTYWMDGKMAAMCLGTLDSYFGGSMFEVAEFAVDPIHQRSGIGSTVMNLLETKLAGYNVEAISLHTSRNLPAYGFYLKNGYEELTENVTLAKLLGEGSLHDSGSN